MPTVLQYHILVSDMSKHVCLTNSLSLTHWLWPSRVFGHSRKPHQLLECTPAISAMKLLGTILKVGKKGTRGETGDIANMSWVLTPALPGQAACRKYGRPQPQLA